MGIFTEKGFSEGLVAIDGSVEKLSEAKISALDRGFLFGESVFETLVGFHNEILQPEQHINRLRVSAEEVSVAIPWSDEQLLFELRELARMVPAEKKSIRLVVSSGKGLSLRAQDKSPVRIVYVSPAGVEKSGLYTQGLALKRKVLPFTIRGALPKASNYWRSAQALRGAANEGFDDILWTNADGEITEAATANIFFVARVGDRVELVTPAPMSGLLLGITRQTILDLCSMASIPASEQIVYADELAKFDEAFVCSTVRGLVPVSRVDGHEYHSVRSTSVYRQIERLYFAWVQSQLSFRVDWNTGIKVD